MNKTTKQIFLDVLTFLLILLLLAVGLVTFAIYGVNSPETWFIYGLVYIGLFIWFWHYFKLKKPRRDPLKFPQTKNSKASLAKENHQQTGEISKSKEPLLPPDKDSLTQRKPFSLNHWFKKWLAFTPPLGQSAPPHQGKCANFADSSKRLLLYNHLGRKLMKPKIGILTASDRAHAGTYKDVSGETIHEALSDYLVDEFEIVYRLQPDDLESLQKTLIELADSEGCCLILTTGGTGPAPRDVTPEATEAVCEKLLPGFGEEMRRVSLRFTPTAIVSRQIAGTRGRSFILNLPGKPRAIMQCLDAIFAAIPDVIDLIGGPRLKCRPHIHDYRHVDS